MKFLELNLKAFGPFTERRIELDNGPGMHLFYGPNEAGKSSVLRAIRSMLFGIEKSTTDNYLHDNKELRVGGILQRADGQFLEFLRRKGNKNTLIDPEGSPLHDDALSPFLGAVDQNLFARLYGLNHETLVEGGQALLNDDGDVAQSLLSASMGPGLRKVVEKLRDEAEELWRRKGHKYIVNQALHDFKDARGRITKATLLPKTWTKAVRELEKIEREISALGQRKLQLGKELSQLERHQEAIPKVAHYRELKDEYAALPETPELAEGFCEERKTKQARLSQLQQGLKTAQIKCDGFKKDLDETPKQDEVLQCEGEITSLVKQIENYRASVTNLSQLAAKLVLLETQADNMATDLKPGATRESLPLPHVGLRLQVAELAQQYRQSQGTLIKSQDDLSALTTELSNLEAQLERLGPLLDINPLEKVESLVRQQIPLDEQISKHRSKTEQQSRLVSRLCAQLPLWEGSAEALWELALPLTETVSQFDSQFVGLQHSKETLGKTLDSARTELARVENELLHLQGGVDLPTRQELMDSRQQRLSLWDEMVSLFRTGDSPKEKQIAEFQDLVQACDKIADRMFEVAGRVADVSAAKRQREAISEKLKGLLLQEQDLQSKHQELLQEWEKQWLPLGQKPLGPKEMRAWLEQRARLLAEVRQADQLCQELLELTEKRGDLISKAMTALPHHPDDSKPEPISLAEALERLQEVLAPRKLAVSQREKLQGDHARVQQDIQKAEATFRRAEESAEKERQGWTRAVEQLTVDPNLEPSELNALLVSFEELRKLKEALAETSAQVQAYREQKSQFEESTEKLALKLGLECRDREAASFVEQLSQQLEEAKEHRQKRRHLSGRLAEVEQETLDLKAQLSQTSIELDEMRLEAGATTLDELPEIEQRASKFRDLTQQLERLEGELRHLSPSQSPDAFCLEVEAADADLIPSLIAEKKAALVEIESERDKLRVCQGELQGEQRRTDGSNQAAEADADAQEALARTRNGVERYMVLSLAGYLLAQEIERYRSTHQGPLVKLASESFARLTLGIYPRLEIGFDEKDKPILLACERNHRKVGLRGLSDGTRDQLFLALRLAVIEHGLQHNEPIPFVADDLLVHFDRERAGAALELLAEFSQKTQVLFFTHLDRDRDLAVRLLGDRVKIHQLERALVI